MTDKTEPAAIDKTTAPPAAGHNSRAESIEEVPLAKISIWAPAQALLEDLTAQEL